MKEEDEERRRQLRHLKGIATEAGFNVRRDGAGRYELCFHGKYRDFDIRMTVANDWVHMSVYVLQLPQAGIVRTRLLERVVELNVEMPLLKFTKNDDVLSLDLEYRREHLDATVFRNLTALLRDLAEEHYPEIFRIVSGQEALESLEEAFQRASSAVE